MDYSQEAINLQQQQQQPSPMMQPQQQQQQLQSPPPLLLQAGTQLQKLAQLQQLSQQQQQQQAQQLASPEDSDGGGGGVPNDWCIPYFGDGDCPQRSNLLFGCVSAANTLSNAFVLVQFNQFQQIVNVYTLDAPNDVQKVRFTPIVTIYSSCYYLQHLLLFTAVVAIYCSCDHLQQLLSCKAAGTRLYTAVCAKVYLLESYAL